MSRLQLVEDQEASGKAREVFEDIRQNFGMVPNLFKAYAHRPEVLEANWNKVKAVMFGGELPRPLKEMVAVVVSRANGCEYCVNAHGGMLRMLGVPRPQIRMLIENLETADLPEDTKVALRLAIKSTREPDSISQEEIEQLRQLGHSNAQIVELLSVVDLFTSFNKFLNTLRVPVDFPAP